MLLDQTKADAFKTQLVRQLTKANPVGVLLCVRSLIEHPALVIWLTQTLEISMDTLAREVEKEAPLPKEAANVTQPLANFLAVHARSSKEGQRSWVTQEIGGVRTAWLNLDKIIKDGLQDAFPESDFFRTLYALSSAAMHGRILRSWEIALNADALTVHSQFLESVSEVMKHERSDAPAA